MVGLTAREPRERSPNKTNPVAARKSPSRIDLVVARPDGQAPEDRRLRERSERPSWPEGPLSREHVSGRPLPDRALPAGLVPRRRRAHLRVHSRLLTRTGRARLDVTRVLPGGPGSFGPGGRSLTHSDFRGPRSAVTFSRSSSSRAAELEARSRTSPSSCARCRRGVRRSSCKPRSTPGRLSTPGAARASSRTTAPRRFPQVMSRSIVLTTRRGRHRSSGTSDSSAFSSARDTTSRTRPTSTPIETPRSSGAIVSSSRLARMNSGASECGTPSKQPAAAGRISRSSGPRSASGRSATRKARRTIVRYQSAAADPVANPALKTVRFADLVPARPVCELLGLAYEGQRDPANEPPQSYVVNPSALGDPWFAGTGFTATSALPDSVGYLWDSVQPGCAVPPLTVLVPVRRRRPARKSHGYGGRSVYGAVGGSRL